ncbi:MAG: hypothetical protein U0P30_15575 [Vicinamibacterales bacterium]
MANRPETTTQPDTRRPASSVAPRDLPPKDADRVVGGRLGGDDDLNDLEVERLRRR